jgi:hypothetical protein
MVPFTRLAEFPIVIALLLASGTATLAQQPEPTPEPAKNPERDSSKETVIYKVAQRGDKCFIVAISIRINGSPPSVISTILSEREVPCSWVMEPQQAATTPSTPSHGENPQPPTQGNPQPPNQENPPQPPTQAGNPLQGWPPGVTVTGGPNGTTIEHHTDGSTVIKGPDGKIVDQTPSPTQTPPRKPIEPNPLQPDPHAFITTEGTFRFIDGRWVRERMIDGRVVRDNGDFVNGHWVSGNEQKPKTVNIPLGGDEPHNTQLPGKTDAKTPAGGGPSPEQHRKTSSKKTSNRKTSKKTNTDVSSSGAPQSPQQNVHIEDLISIGIGLGRGLGGGGYGRHGRD